MDFCLAWPWQGPSQSLLLDSRCSPGDAQVLLWQGLAPRSKGEFSLLQLQTEPGCLHHVYGFEQMNPAPVGPLKVWKGFTQPEN